MSTTGKTIKHDGENHVVVEILACGISKDDTVLKVVVLIMESVLRWSVGTETNGLLERLVTNGVRSNQVRQRLCYQEVIWRGRLCPSALSQ